MKVEISRRALKSLKKLPARILESFDLWKQTIEVDGIEAMRSVRGYNDEALRGKLKNMRSSRLSSGYRVYYREIGTTMTIVFVEEINNHDYKKIERLFK